MQKRAILFFLVPVATASASGCHSSSSPAQQPTPNAPALLQQDCDPMVPTECGFPFPSSVWTQPDATTKTGFHLYFGDATLPQWQQGSHITRTPWLGRDGFSPGGAIMTHLPGATETGLADAYHIDQSMAATSPTILVEYDTGARVPHWAELDHTMWTDDDTRTFFIHPALRLKDATRYVVAIRHVVDSSGAPLPVNPVFQALRDGTPSTDLSVGPRRALYADILSKLQASGIDTSDLQLAWDFTTASKEDTTKYLVAMRDDALAKVGSDGPAYMITTVTENPNPYIRRRIEGMMTVPLYTDIPGPGATLNLVNGLPAVNGTAQFPFLVQIPNSLVNSGKAGAIVQNAHGLFGDQSEGKDSFMAETCDRYGYVEIAVNLIGMDHTDFDSGFVPNTLASDLAGFSHVVDRLQQGFVNELLAMRMMMGKMSQDPATIFDGKPTIDPTTRFYRGDSQGGISGGVYMAVSTDVTRGLLGEPGAPYNTLLDRSKDFGVFFTVIKGVYSSAVDQEFIIGLAQQLWDRAEPDGYVPYISKDLLPNTPSHNVLLHVAIGDQQVTPLGAHFIARSIGAQSLKPANREIFGIPDADSGFSGNGMVEFNFWLPPSQSPVQNVPPPGGTDPSTADPHDALRQLPWAQDMEDIFFRTGTVVQTCPGGGPCAAPMNWQNGGLLAPPPDGGTYEDGGMTSAGDAATGGDGGGTGMGGGGDSGGGDSGDGATDGGGTAGDSGGADGGH